MQIGFIGLGAMGRGMAANLVRAGFPITVFDVRREAVDALGAQGAIAARNPAEAAIGADLVCVAVFDHHQVRRVLVGEGEGAGVFSTALPGCVIAVHTTTPPSFVAEMAALADRHGVTVVDVAMTGGSALAADAGELTFMVGGAAEDVDRARPAFDVMARTIFHLGPLGSGMGAKIVSNFLSAGNLALVREAERIASALGFGEEQMLEVVNAGKVGASWVTEHWDRIRRQETELAEGIAGPAEIVAKDLRLAGDLARSLDLSAPVLAALVADSVPDILATGVTVRPPRPE
jgi:3-hydroxyisobutyrate dehydrogenase-like beta-hydroxyacid dehydrogenase